MLPEQHWTRRRAKARAACRKSARGASPAAGLWVRLIPAMVLTLGMAGRGECAKAGPVNFEGNLDLVFVARVGQEAINTQNFAEKPFNNARIRLHADAPVHDHVHVFTQFFYDDGNMKARLFGGFVRLSDPKGRDL
ncbi:MAG TPA: hypothetical protein VGJ98_05285, partial [Candidatus Eisenbacteria bacterium]